MLVNSKQDSHHLETSSINPEHPTAAVGTNRPGSPEGAVGNPARQDSSLVCRREIQVLFASERLQFT